MNNSLSSAIGFVIGVAIGAVTTWQLTKKIYEQISNDEIASVKEVYAKKMEQIDGHNSETVTENSDESDDSNEEDMMHYAQLLKKESYFNYSNSDETAVSNANIPLSKQISDEENIKPYVISPDDFGVDEEYDRIALTYYSDNILADDNDEQVVDIDNLVGLESLESFGEYDDDVVHVVNDRLKTYFEISRDERTYYEVLELKPYLMEG